MDIFIRDVPQTATPKQARSFFAGPLAEFGIDFFHCELFQGKPFAVLTVLDIPAGQRFLAIYGLPINAPRTQRPYKTLVWLGKRLRCAESKTPPNEYNLKSIVYEMSQSIDKGKVQLTESTNDNTKLRRFNVCSMNCGNWDYEKSQLRFVAEYTCVLAGTITFGQREAVLLLQQPNGDQVRIDIAYWSCEHVILCPETPPTVSITLRFSPKMYKAASEAHQDPMDQIQSSLCATSLNERSAQKRLPTKQRVLGIDASHESISGIASVYRLFLSDHRDTNAIAKLLYSSTKAPATVTLETSFTYAFETLSRWLTRLDNELASLQRNGKLSFSIGFQLTRIARNGALHPLKVMQLLPTIQRLMSTNGIHAVVSALGRLCTEMPIPGPHVELNVFEVPNIEKRLEVLVGDYDKTRSDNPFEISRRYAHINLIHKIVITPTTMRLEGPEPEPTNRVLRRYFDHTDHFIRVVFLDECGSSVRYDPKSSQYEIFHRRFKSLLDGTILIAGRGFSFLGFSNSSLRSQSCWFMAPLFRGGQYALAPQVLKELGDFSHIRTPAKCAARIGQNFTDTNSTVNVRPEDVGELPLIIKNGYDFADGVGTISLKLLRKIWQVYGTKRLLKPTVLQVRFQGAKGVVALDSRLEGERLMLRSNMRKFETASVWDVEICGAGFRPLPMVLNRQFIKILEDLSVNPQVFLDLQADAVNLMRYMTESSVNTATFLDSVSGMKASRISSLISRLGDIGLDYHMDSFLYSVVELAVVAQLQDIKYRGRIPVHQGVTLYGVVDETGFLREGEIFVITEKAPEGGREVLVKDPVIITRSPALHPGDVQIVRAVDVPPNSPLKQLSNVVVFSQHGSRDLPSQLSGGDLDGDLYNVIYDDRLIPQESHKAALYPRIKPLELERPVTAKDMSDFFVTFMESDLLGMISNVHLQLADIHPEGTKHPDCVRLAEMASIAVDFSKTGIAVNMGDCPRYPRPRPDFMSPSPRVVIVDGLVDFEDSIPVVDDSLGDIDQETRPMRFYKSEKILGRLFRAIDERQFVASMQTKHRREMRISQAASLMARLRDYMLHWSTQYGILYEHHLDLAREIRAA